jgi:hypothetical protein
VEAPEVSANDLLKKILALNGGRAVDVVPSEYNDINGSRAWEQC